MSGLGWLERLERSSMRKQYLLSLVLIGVVLLLTTLVCAGAVIWASVSMRNAEERIVALGTANRAVLQDMTDADTGLASYRVRREQSSLAPYEFAMNFLPFDQRRLRGLAAGNTRLATAVQHQADAIEVWLTEYATPTLDGRHRSVAEFNRLFDRGQDLFKDVRASNKTVQARIDQEIRHIKSSTRTVLIIALLFVILLPLLAVLAVFLVVRRMGDSVVKPLSDVSDVLDRLSSGDTQARATVTGPEEIREIASALNRLTDENVRAREVEADVLTQLETIDRVRTDLVSTVSHELRTPLTSISGYLELLQDDLVHKMSPQQATMMGAIRRNLDRLNELITNLLALSRAEETQLSVEPVDLRGIAAEVAGDVRLTAAARDITVRTLQSAAPVVVLGDRSQLIRAVANLVTNAVKFSRQGGVVELRVTQESGHALLEVVDEGIGIPAKDLAGLGSRFYRASNAMQAEIAGTGLGLRIVQTILDRHDGTLAVDSVEGEGSTFTIRLPVTRSGYGQVLAARAVEPSYD